VRVMADETAATETPEDIPCAVCMDGDEEDENLIVFCDGCDVAVHQACYGGELLESVPEGEWRCSKCRATQKQTKRAKAIACELCPVKTGVFKQSDQGQWAHLACAIWLPETYMEDNVKCEPICGLDAVDPRRRRMTCVVCKTNSGACIQCGFGQCKVAYHVGCALKPDSGVTMRLIEPADDESPAARAHVCKTHANKIDAVVRKITPREERQKSETPVKRGRKPKKEAEAEPVADQADAAQPKKRRRRKQDGDDKSKVLVMALPDGHEPKGPVLVATPIKMGTMKKKGKLTAVMQPMPNPVHMGPVHVATAQFTAGPTVALQQIQPPPFVASVIQPRMPTAAPAATTTATGTDRVSIQNLVTGK